MKGKIDSRTAERRCAQLAGRQHGVISRAQARESGLSDRQIHGRLAKRLWKQWLPGTFVVADAPSTWQQSVVAACLWAGSGAALSHWSAAALLGFEGVRYPRIEITSTKRLQSSRVLVHHEGIHHA